MAEIRQIARSPIDLQNCEAKYLLAIPSIHLPLASQICSTLRANPKIDSQSIQSTSQIINTKKKLDPSWNKIFKPISNASNHIKCFHGHVCILKTRMINSIKTEIWMCPNPSGLSNSLCKPNDKGDNNNCRFVLDKKHENILDKYPRKPPICNHGYLCQCSKTKNKSSEN